MAAVAPDTDEWQPPPHEPEMGDIESYQAFARALNAPPKKLIPIGERDRRYSAAGLCQFASFGLVPGFPGGQSPGGAERVGAREHLVALFVIFAPSGQ